LVEIYIFGSERSRKTYRKESSLILTAPAKSKFGLPRIILPRTQAKARYPPISGQTCPKHRLITPKKGENTLFWPGPLIIMPEIRPMVQFLLILPKVPFFGIQGRLVLSTLDTKFPFLYYHLT
jgi:hypothetical protein